ncbi:hypothetical protein HD806DRAFT_511806 [Xylariaceae sp. AK1471]|nr:hypothetical protein HD806DRAFT_511806 [Xylariaceae sp. AK1471]
MGLLLREAKCADVGRIAEIHMAAFGPNRMLHAQFSMPALHAALQNCIALKARADIDDPKTTVLVIQNEGALQSTKESEKLLSETKKDTQAPIVAFAKWSHPVTSEDNYVEPPWIWPEGTRLEVLNSWAEKTEKAQSEALGDAPCYRLAFMGTDPSHGKQGAASLLLQWGIDQCKRHRVPGYLESTVEAAAFYEKRGFKSVGIIAQDISPDHSDKYEVYQETIFVFFPNAEVSSHGH